MWTNIAIFAAGMFTGAAMMLCCAAQEAIEGVVGSHTEDGAPCRSSKQS